MSVIIQAGHQSSKSQELIEQLYDNGLNQPLPSYTHQLDTHKVVDSIDKIIAKNAGSVLDSKLADTIMVDFLLANIDNEEWGWASHKNLDAMTYWRQLDADARIILVFDHPKCMFSNLDFNSVTADMIHESIIDWIEYHERMLELLNQGYDNVLLLEGAGGLENIKNSQQKGIDVSDITDNFILESKKPQNNEGYQANTNSVIQNQSVSPRINQDSNTHVDSHILIDKLLSRYPTVISIFNTLLEKSDIHCSNHLNVSVQADIEELLVQYQSSRYQNQDKQQLEYENQQLTHQLHRLQEDYEQLHVKESTHNTEIVNQLHDMQESFEILLEEHKHQSISHEKQNSAQVSDFETNSSLLKENETLVKQLHKLQENLENVYAKPNDVEIIHHAKIMKENQLLMAQLHNVQDELERLYSRVESG